MFVLFESLSVSRTQFLKPSPTRYKWDDTVLLYAGPLRSPTNLISYDYTYNDLFPQTKMIEEKTTILDPLMGRSFMKIPFNLTLGNNERCKTFSKMEINQSKYSYYYYLIENNYEKSLIIDNLPFLSRNSKNVSVPNYAIGYIGVLDSKNFVDSKEIHLINHFDFTIVLNPESNKTYTIAEAYLKPYIIDPCSKNNPSALADMKEDIVSYSVEWIIQEKAPHNRYYNVYSNSRTISGYKSHNYIFLIEFFIIVFFPFLFTYIIKYDVYFYKNVFSTLDEEVAGWEVISGDVFRIPDEITNYSYFIAPGIRFGLDFLLIFSICIFNVVTPANTDLFWLLLLIIDFISSFIGGFVSGAHFKQFNGKDSDIFHIYVSSVPSVIVFIPILLMNLIFTAEHATSSIQMSLFLFGSLFIVIISGCFMYVGSIFGFKVKRQEYPQRINLIPRQIPHSKLKYIIFVCGGFLIALSLYVYQSSVKSAIFCDLSLFKLFPDLAEMAFVLICSSMVVTVLSVYLILKCEDYWWWKFSMYTSLLSGLFYIMFDMYFFFRKMLKLSFSTKLLFLIITFSSGALVSVISAAFGFIASYFAIKYMYTQFDGK
ncbi:hypothetical protein TVAG_237780 [Trichomonas vaginalis G3]|uniref:Transmembrane 9 superfamily member n=1 Tax=Trichomonas vaginalis (strain ATCC PRA-98 / G3) TaxID=412133 RepID=A2DCX8_TRIV3|nr:positive regulation of protein exit from endoplasmic reticulum [Trichomonas vaginalis G3]EAY21752.1 hypothetical protein TVAG_237780 [Trichomonas vaginalis G3]KAI5524273.1 positive regulation of protein exit from endoplasmic reticulum [Trichomonas vaginalis G3]|eukprot:XP_001582738.1 hypothetical protein [Trichomonas vaginalis G3]